MPLLFNQPNDLLINICIELDASYLTLKYDKTGVLLEDRLLRVINRGFILKYTVIRYSDMRNIPTTGSNLKLIKI